MKRPDTPREWVLYRARLSCQVGRDALEDRHLCPPGSKPIEYAIFNLLHAVEEIASALWEQDNQEEERA